MIKINKIKIGDKVVVGEQCAYCVPGHSEIPVNVGDVGMVVFIDLETRPHLMSDWPVRVHLEGHEHAYLFGLNELNYFY